MARFPSGIPADFPGAGVDDPKARAAQMALEMDVLPIATTAPCMNPECGGPVDYLGNGPPVRYCSKSCRNRVPELRRRATQQLEMIEQTLAETKGRHDVPRDELTERAHLLRWWLLRLSPPRIGDDL